MKECNQDTIKIQEVAYDTLCILVNSSYRSGSILLNEDNVYDLMTTAVMLQFIKVMDQCTEYLMTHISPFNCLEVNYISYEANIRELRKFKETKNE